MAAFVVTIGEILVEIMATKPGNGFVDPLELVGPFPSGAPAIFIDQVAKQGQPCAIVSRVGRDDFGTCNLERLRRDGVDVSAVAIDNDRPTGSAFVRYRADGNRDFVFNIRHAACGHIAFDAAVEALLERATHLHVMGSSLNSPSLIEMNRRALKTIKGKGGTVSFDPNVRKEILKLGGLFEALDEVLGQTDVFLPSGDELVLFGKTDDTDNAIRAVLGRGVGCVVLKRGAGGASYHDRNRQFSVPGYPVTELDPTGAGDSFGGTFVTRWLAGAVPEAALAAANAAGALAVLRKGPMEGTSTPAEIEAFMAKEAARI